MTLHLSFTFALAYLMVSVLSSAFNGPKATLAVSDEASLADEWTPRPTPGPVLRNIRRRATPNVLTELRAPDNVCGYYQKSQALSWFCPATATCIAFPGQTNAPGFIGCDSDTALNFLTNCVDYSHYVTSSSIYNSDSYIRKCTNPGLPYCNTVSFPEVNVQAYACDSTSASTTDLYYTDYTGDIATRQLVELDITITTTSTSDHPQSTSPIPKPAPNPAPKSHMAVIVGVVVGALVVIGLVALGTFVYSRKRRQRRLDSSVPEVAQM